MRTAIFQSLLHNFPYSKLNYEECNNFNGKFEKEILIEIASFLEMIQ